MPGGSFRPRHDFKLLPATFVGWISLCAGHGFPGVCEWRISLHWRASPPRYQAQLGTALQPSSTPTSQAPFPYCAVSCQRGVSWKPCEAGVGAGGRVEARRHQSPSNRRPPWTSTRPGSPSRRTTSARGPKTTRPPQAPPSPPPCRRSAPRQWRGGWRTSLRAWTWASWRRSCRTSTRCCRTCTPPPPTSGGAAACCTASHSEGTSPSPTNPAIFLMVKVT